MREVKITGLDAGTRLDRYLKRYLPSAPGSFVYKMLRKKNIKRNGERADGSERLLEGDILTLYLAEETIKKFSADPDRKAPVFQGLEQKKAAPVRSKKKPDGSDFELGRSIIYEDSHILILNKAAGVLSQKAKPDDFSLVEHITKYLLETGAVTEEALHTFHPGICNRLDRNTSGIVVAGKTSEGLRRMGALLKERTVKKYYLTIVKGRIETEQRIEGYLWKDHSHNKVRIIGQQADGAELIQTEYLPLRYVEGYTLLKVHLITGKSHQIRAHLAEIGHPVAGDGKYGDVAFNRYFAKQFGLRFHLLHAEELVFPVMEAAFSDLSHRTFRAPLPSYFETIIRSLF